MRMKGLVDAVFPDGILGITSGGLDGLIQNGLLRQGDEWVPWPRAVQSLNEPDMVDFVNIIGKVAKVHIFNDKDPRRCSSMFHERGVPDTKWKTNYKPGGVIIDDEECGLVTWALIKTVIETKSKKLKEGIKQGSRYAHLIFDAQPGRHFVPTVVVAGSRASLVLYDRSGSLHSEEIDIHEDVHKFLRLILGMLFADEGHLGYDSSLKKRSGVDGLYIETSGVTYRVDCIYHEPGVEGRGTVCYRGVSQVDNSVVAIKDTWVDVLRKESEVEILKKLNKEPAEKLSTPDGVRVIPEFVSSENVKRRRPGLEPGSWILVDASTEMFRGEMVERDALGKAKWAWSSTEDENKVKIEIRTLVRVVTKPFGQKLETFTSKKVLMRAFSDIIHAIQILFDLGYIHRDISLRNILLYQHNGTLRGLLIDYDYTVSIKRASTEAVAERTGTIPFMAMDRLRPDPLFHHNYFHDLESIFYVICWISTLYAGPYSRKRLLSDKFPYSKTSIAVWNGDDNGDRQFHKLLMCKRGSVRDPEGFAGTLAQFAEYFGDIKKCMSELQKLLFQPVVLDPKEFQTKAETLNERFNAKLSERVPEVTEEMVAEYGNIPLGLRHHVVVFTTVQAVLDNVICSLAEEESVSNVGEGSSGGIDIAPRRATRREFEYTPAAEADFTHGRNSRLRSGTRSKQKMINKSKGDPVSSSSRTSQKRKSGEESPTSSSSKRNKSESLQTPGNSMSELIAEPIAEVEPSPRSRSPLVCNLSMPHFLSSNV